MPIICRLDFSAYADICFREFGDRVRHWTTFNEANIFTQMGYDYGFLPPQRCSPLSGLFNCQRGNSSTEPYLAAHNILLAHASAARLYRKKYRVKTTDMAGAVRQGKEKITKDEQKHKYLIDGNMLVFLSQNEQKGYIGFNLIAFYFTPWTNTAEDIIATQRANDFYHGW